MDCANLPWLSTRNHSINEGQSRQSLLVSPSGILKEGKLWAERRVRWQHQHLLSPRLEMCQKSQQIAVMNTSHLRLNSFRKGFVYALPYVCFSQGNTENYFLFSFPPVFPSFYVNITTYVHSRYCTAVCRYCRTEVSPWVRQKVLANKAACNAAMKTYKTRSKADTTPMPRWWRWSPWSCVGPKSLRFTRYQSICRGQVGNYLVGTQNIAQEME